MKNKTETKETYDALRAGLTALSEFIEAKKNIPLAQLIEESAEINQLVTQNEKLINLVKNCLANERAEDSSNSVQNEIITLFFSVPINQVALKNKLIQIKKVIEKETISKQRKDMGKRIAATAHPKIEDYAEHINLCLLEMMDNIVCLARYAQIQTFIDKDSTIVIQQLVEKIGERVAPGTVPTFLHLAQINWTTLKIALQRKLPMQPVAAAGTSVNSTASLALSENLSSNTSTTNLDNAPSTCFKSESTPAISVSQPSSNSQIVSLSANTRPTPHLSPNESNPHQVYSELETTFRKLNGETLPQTLPSTSANTFNLAKLTALAKKQLQTENAKILEIPKQYQMEFEKLLTNHLEKCELLNNHCNTNLQLYFENELSYHAVEKKILLPSLKGLLEEINSLDKKINTLIKRSQSEFIDLLGDTIKKDNIAAVIIPFIFFLEQANLFKTTYLEKIFTDLHKRITYSPDPKNTIQSVISTLNAEIEKQAKNIDELASASSLHNNTQDYSHAIEIRDICISYVNCYKIQHLAKLKSFYETEINILNTISTSPDQALETIEESFNEIKEELQTLLDVQLDPTKEEILSEVTLLLLNSGEEHKNKISNYLGINLTLTSKEFIEKLNEIIQNKESKEKLLAFLKLDKDLTPEALIAELNKLLLGEEVKNTIATQVRLSCKLDHSAFLAAITDWLSEKNNKKSLQRFLGLDQTPDDLLENINQLLADKSALDISAITSQTLLPLNALEEGTELKKAKYIITEKLQTYANTIKILQLKQKIKTANLTNPLPKSPKEKLEEAENENAKLSRKLEDFRTTNKTLQSKYEEISTELQSAQAKKKEIEEALAILKIERDSLFDKKVTADQALSRIEQQHTDLNETFTDYKSDMIFKISEQEKRQTEKIHELEKKAQSLTQKLQIEENKTLSNTETIVEQQLTKELEKIKREKATVVEESKKALEEKTAHYETLQKDNTKKISALELHIQTINANLEAEKLNSSSNTALINELTAELLLKNSELLSEKETASNLKGQLSALRIENLVEKEKLSERENISYEKLSSEEEKNRLLNQELEQLGKKCNAFISKVKGELSELTLGKARKSFSQRQKDFHSITLGLDDSDSEEETFKNELDQSSYNKKLLFEQFDSLQEEIKSVFTRLIQKTKASSAIPKADHLSLLPSAEQDDDGDRFDIEPSSPTNDLDWDEFSLTQPSLEAQYLALKKELEETNERIVTLETDIGILRDTSEQTLKEQLEDKSILEVTIEGLHKEIAELTLAKEKIEHDRDIDQAEIIRLQKETKIFVEQQQILEAVQKQLVETEAAAEKSATEMLGLQKELTDLTAEKETLIKTQKNYSAIEVALGEVKAKKLKLETQLKQLESQTVTTTAEKDEIIAGLRARSEEIETEIKTLREEKERIKFDKEVYDKTLEKIESELDKKKAVELADLAKEKELLIFKIEQLRKENQNPRKNLGVEVSTQTDLKTDLEYSHPSASFFASEISISDAGTHLQDNLSSASSESGEEDGVGLDNAAQQGTYNKDFTDLNLPPSPVQSPHDTNKRGPRMLLSEEQVKQLLQNPQFQTAFNHELKAWWSEYCEEGIKIVIRDLRQLSPRVAQAQTHTQNLFKNLQEKVNYHFFPPENSGAENGMGLTFLSDQSRQIQNEVFSALQKAPEDLGSSNFPGVAQFLIDELINNNQDNTREFYPHSNKLLTNGLNQIKIESRKLAQVIETLEDKRSSLIQFTTMQLIGIATQAANKHDPLTTNWKHSTQFNEEVSSKLVKISSDIVTYLLTKAPDLSTVINILPDSFTAKDIGKAIEVIMPKFLDDLVYGKKAVSVIAQVKKIGIHTAQKLTDGTQHRDSDNAFPSASRPISPTPSEVNSDNSTFPKLPEASQLNMPTNPTSSAFPNANRTDELELTPLNSSHVQRRPSSSSTPSFTDSEDESESNDRTTQRLKRQRNRLIIKKVPLKPEKLSAAVAAFVNDGALPKKDEEAMQQLRVLQYVNTEEEEFSLAIQAVCSMSEDVNAEDLISNETFSKLRHQLRTEAAIAIPNNPSDSITPQEIDTLAAKPWLERKLRKITHRLVDIGLTEAEKLKTTKIVQKEFPLSELNLSAIALKSPDELQAEIAKLKQSELKLIAQSYQEFSGIESLLPHYPLLIKESNDDVSSESGDSGIEDQSELQRFKADLNEKLSEPISEDQATYLINAISKRIEPSFHKWGLLGARLDPKLIKAIVADLSYEEIPRSLSKEELVSKAINLLLEEHQLGRTLKERQEWEKGIKLHYAAIEAVSSLRTKVKHRLDLLEAMQLKKNEYNDEDIKREEESKTYKELPNGEFDQSTRGQPLPVYLPSDCRVINEEPNLAQQTPNFSVAGEVFQRRDTLAKNETVVYEQNLGIRKQEWSITRTQNNTLDYKTKWEHRWNPKSVTTKEVAFTQMIDAIQSFKRSKIIHFNFNNCTKETEKKYWLFIRAYGELGIGPSLYCPANKKLKMKTSEIEETKAFIIKQLKLQTEELDSNEKNILRFTSLLEAANIQPSIRIR